jgi:hypothetical protein
MAGHTAPTQTPTSGCHSIMPCVGADCFVGLASELKEPFVHALRGMCKLGLVDGHITSNLICSLATKLDLRCLIGTTSLRQKITGWCHDTWSFLHCKVGGVTTCSIQGSASHQLNGAFRSTRCKHRAMSNGASTQILSGSN